MSLQPLDDAGSSGINEFCELLKESSIEEKYKRRRDPETGRLIVERREEQRKRMGEGNKRYIPEEREKFNKDFRPNVGERIDYLFRENIYMEGEGKKEIVVRSFEEMNLVLELRRNVQKLRYSRPLPIQRATFSLISNGYDVIAHAATGAGKTAAFMIPVVNWILRQKKAGVRKINRSPFCIVLSPTKELAEQLYNGAKEFADGTDCKAVLAMGETDRRTTIAQIQKGCDICFATAGRLCDFIANDVLDLNYVQFVVFDEADALLGEENFYEDVKLLLDKIPKSRVSDVQSLLFSATDCGNVKEFKDKGRLRRCATTVVVGILNGVNPHIKQEIIQVDPWKKHLCLLCYVEMWYKNARRGEEPKLIVFVNTKRRSSVLACYLSLHGYKAYPVNADLTANLRREGLSAFEKGECHILVGTDVISRGVDLKVTHVLNYEIPSRERWSSYVHRVGRTGRLGNVGEAVTFYTKLDSHMALILYQWLSVNKQRIPPFLEFEAKRQSEIEQVNQAAYEEYKKMIEKNEDQFGNYVIEESESESEAD